MIVTTGILLSIAIISVLVGGIFFVRAWRSYTKIERAHYGVGRQEQRSRMLASLTWGTLLIIASSFSWLILSVNLQVGAEPEANVIPTEALPALTLTPLLTMTPVIIPTGTPLPVVTIQPTMTPTTPPDIPTQTPFPTPTMTTTPQPPTAIVNSPNGLYLRDVPGGDVTVELIDHATELILLEGEETSDGFEWRRVRTPLGNEGWVALDFIIVVQN